MGIFDHTSLCKNCKAEINYTFFDAAHGLKCEKCGAFNTFEELVIYIVKSDYFKNKILMKDRKLKIKKLNNK